MRHRPLVTLGLAAALALASCGGAATSSPAASAAPTAGSTASAPPAVPAAAVRIAGFAFDPPTITVKTGTTVTWTNEDSATHTITWADGTPPSGSLKKGGAPYARTFDAPGTYAYACGIHPSMRGEVVVQP
jgi:plastocyanin